mgnify:CR=1 FL=1
MQFTDEWLVPTVERLVSAEMLERRRQTESAAPVCLWTTLVQQRLATDEDVLRAAAARFRLPIADLSQLDARVRETVPEQLARRFSVLPLRLTDSYLEVASSNPFDIDAEKGLAFATGREVRIFLAPPSRLQEKLDEV